MSGGSKSGGTVKVKLPGYIQEYSKDVLQRGSNELDRPYQAYTGQRVPDFSANETEFLSGLYKPGMDKAEGAADMAAQSWIDPGVAESYISPYIKNVADIAQRDMQEQYQKILLANKVDALGAGGYGDAGYGLTQAQTNEDYLRALSDMYSKNYADAYTTGAGIFDRDRAAASGAAGLYGTLAAQKSGLAKDVAGYERGINQMKADADYADYVEARDWNKNTLSWFAQLLGSSPGTREVTQQNGGGGTNWISTGIGAGLMGASIAAPYLAASDEAVKRDIVPIEDALAALNAARPATYRYLPGFGHREDTHAGLIAQSVEGIPGAVFEVDGVKHVDPWPVIAFLVRAVQQLSEKSHAE